MKKRPKSAPKHRRSLLGRVIFASYILGQRGNEELPTSPGFCKDYFVINDFEKQLISVVKIQCIPHPFCNMDLPITKHS